MLPVILVIAVLAGFASPARAEEVPAGGPMHYTRIKDAQANDTEHIKIKTIKPEDDEDAKKDDGQPSTRIWNKYRALAAGQYKDEDDKKKEDGEDAAKQDEDKDTETVKEEEKEKIEKAPAEPTGIAAIIDEYRRNKAQRSQMHTLTVTKPSDLQPAAGESKEEPKEKPEG